MKVKFVSDGIAVLEKGPQTLFNAGDVLDLNLASAERWIRRGVAVAVSDADIVVPSGKKKGKKADTGKVDE